MTTITREQQKQILIDTANHVISRDNTSPYSEKLRELARIALASLEAEPIGAFHIADQQVGGTSDYIKDGEWPIDNGVIEVYAAQPASERERIRHEHAEWSYADPVVFTDERNLHHIARGRETSLIWGKQNQEVGDIPLYRHAQPVPVVPEEIPKGLAGQIVSLLAHNIGDKFLAQKIWNACRAAVLHGDEPVSQTYKLNELSGNSPVTQDGWISCSERMPVIGELNWRTSFPLLITCDIGVIPAYYGFVSVNGDKHYGFMDSLKYGDDRGDHPQTNEYGLISNVTHWMPLPEPPI